MSQGEKKTVGARVKQCVKRALPGAYKTSLWLLKIMLPVSLLVTLLSYFNILPYISSFVAPFFRYVGLPGDAALVFITSVFTNIYTVIALIANLDFTVREGVIMATMCLISHGFIIETAVVTKTGSSAVRMIILRVACSFVVAFALNWIMPEMKGSLIRELVETLNFQQTMVHWLLSSLKLCLQIVLIITGLMILQRLLEEFGVLKILSKIFTPFMWLFGLPSSVSFLWIIGNTVGLAYGSAVMVEAAREGNISNRDADLLNHHLVISHSQLEDPLLFSVLGLPLLWLIIPRLSMAIIVVWLRRGELALRKMLNK